MSQQRVYGLVRLVWFSNRVGKHFEIVIVGAAAVMGETIDHLRPRGHVGR